MSGASDLVSDDEVLSLSACPSPPRHLLPMLRPRCLQTVMMQFPFPTPSVANAPSGVHRVASRLPALLLCSNDDEALIPCPILSRLYSTSILCARLQPVLQTSGHGGCPLGYG
jgi:hypothetical protein